jgi:catechol 2,3-dioxygenase-like lactoylglutathione lyase family enzyme
MAYGKKSYVEHVAVKVRDIDWHLRFFHDVLGMSVRKITGPAGKPESAWTIGGMQFNADPGFDGPEGRMAHIGIMVEDLEAVLAEAEKHGIRELPMGRNWLALPDGLELELMQARENSVAEALAVKPRA